MKIQMALKSRRYILDLDRVKLSLEIFFFSSWLMEIFSPAFRIYLYFCQKGTLPVALTPAWFLGGQFIFAYVHKGNFDVL